jgi:hypothetical protein
MKRLLIASIIAFSLSACATTPRQYNIAPDAIASDKEIQPDVLDSPVKEIAKKREDGEELKPDRKE